MRLPLLFSCVGAVAGNGVVTAAQVGSSGVLTDVRGFASTHILIGPGCLLVGSVRIGETYVPELDAERSRGQRYRVFRLEDDGKEGE